MLNYLVAVFFPSATPGGITNAAGANYGTVLQVINIATGADVTSYFSPSASPTTIIQLASGPTTTDPHVALIQIDLRQQTEIGLAVITSAGTSSGTTASVTANGLNVGDIVLQVLFPTTFYSGNAQDVTASFSPFIITANTIQQIDGAVTSHPLIVLVRRAGVEQTKAFFGIMDSVFPNGTHIFTPAGFSQDFTLAGSKVIQILDIVSAADVTANFCSYLPQDGKMAQINSASINDSNTYLVLFESNP